MSEDKSSVPVCVYLGETLGRYGFGEGHPLSPDRMQTFRTELTRQGLDARVSTREPVMATQQDIELFHTHAYVQQVKEQSLTGVGYLDYGDTPAFRGMYEAASCVVGCGLDALRRIMQGECRRAFVPIGGLHHARRNSAAGFCVFNDCGVVIETLRVQYGVRRVAYVDIDVHHGDGVFYAFEDDPDLFIADFHEDGRYLYPGTGFPHETGRGEATGTKCNIPFEPGADDRAFENTWHAAETLLRDAVPEFILFQCGADGLAGDPLAHLRYSPLTHARVARRLCVLADQYCAGRVLAWGGGGYDFANLARAWCAVVKVFLE